MTMLQLKQLANDVEAKEALAKLAADAYQVTVDALDVALQAFLLALNEKDAHIRSPVVAMIIRFILHHPSQSGPP